ncbi:MAG: PilZ domain-containing protein [Spirochaetaceae bacterium]|nr:PilZ domain-containing protein [Spirochaetaceae bacterium]
MKEKRSFRRNDTGAAPGTLIVNKQKIKVIFENISLVGARVKALEEKHSLVGSEATLSLDMDGHCFFVKCRIVELEKEGYYRLRFKGIGEESLRNLMIYLGKLSKGHFNPEQELPNLILEVN